MGVGENIRRSRKAAGLSQIALAERLGMSYMTVRRWEAGKRTPRTEELQRIADALDTTVPELMGLDAPEANARPIRGPFVMVPVLAPQSTVCCGPGADVSDVLPEVEWEEPIPEAWLTGPRGEYQFYITHVDGDSMEPTIQDGERVLVNPNQEPHHGDIVVACWRGRSMVKGVLFDRSGDIRLIPINKQYSDIVIQRDDAPYELEFKGVVIRFLGKDRVSRGCL